MKQILALAFLTLFATVSVAKEKLYVLNSASTGGSFNSQMIAYVEDLKQYYDVEYVQGKGCNKASAVIDNIVANNHQVFYIWNGLRTADFLNNKNPLCGKIPDVENFVNSVLKFAVFFTVPDGINGKDIFKDGVKVGYNSNTNKRYLSALADHHGVEWQLVRYENSKGVTLGVLNKEVDFGMINSAASYWKKSDKLEALYTLNPNGENGIKPLASASSFDGATWGVADLFLIEGGDNGNLRARVAKILADPNSKIHQWYKLARGYTQTIEMDIQTAVTTSNNAISSWVE